MVFRHMAMELELGRRLSAQALILAIFNSKQVLLAPQVL